MDANLINYKNINIIHQFYIIIVPSNNFACLLVDYFESSKDSDQAARCADEQSVLLQVAHALSAILYILTEDEIGIQAVTGNVFGLKPKLIIHK